MKRLCLLLLLVGCGERADNPGNTTDAKVTGAVAPSVPAPPAPTAPAPAPAVTTAAAVTMADKSDLLDFSYVWPAAAAAIPALDARLRADAKTSRQRALNGAREDRATRPSDAPWHAHSMDKTWTVEGEAAGLVAFRDEFWTYTGGAHGMSGFEAILWDRAANDDIAFWSLFRDRKAAVAALTRLYCPALDEAREDKRGGPTPPDAEMDWMTACPDITKQIVIPAQARDGHFTAVRVLIGPYEAGPYAEGSYEIEVPVTAGLAAMLRPERAGAMAAR